MKSDYHNSCDSNMNAGESNGCRYYPSDGTDNERHFTSITTVLVSKKMLVAIKVLTFTSQVSDDRKTMFFNLTTYILIIG